MRGVSQSEDGPATFIDVEVIQITVVDIVVRVMGEITSAVLVNPQKSGKHVSVLNIGRTNQWWRPKWYMCSSSLN